MESSFLTHLVWIVHDIILLLESFMISKPFSGIIYDSGNRFLASFMIPMLLFGIIHGSHTSVWNYLWFPYYCLWSFLFRIFAVESFMIPALLYGVIHDCASIRSRSRFTYCCLQSFMILMLLYGIIYDFPRLLNWLLAGQEKRTAWNDAAKGLT